MRVGGVFGAAIEAFDGVAQGRVAGLRPPRRLLRKRRPWTVISWAGMLTGLYFRGGGAAFEGRSFVARSNLKLYFGTVKSAAGGRHVMAWADSREHALDLVEAALTVTEPVQGSVVGPLMSLPADVMKPGVYVEATPGP
jgi:hypothetical protein